MDSNEAGSLKSCFCDAGLRKDQFRKPVITYRMVEKALLLYKGKS